MQYIQGELISYIYDSNAEYTLNDCTFRLDSASRVGLVGDNGSGKSTLLKIIAGTLKPEGNLSTHMKTAVLSQEINHNCECVADLLYSGKKELQNLREQIMSDSVDDLSVFDRYEESGGWQYEADIEKWLNRFSFPSLDINRHISTLSGGEKTRLRLIALLLDNPDILLLDEPTNHIDLSTIQWLENFLTEQKIPYLIISHDREFLDAVTTSTWEIEEGTLADYAGNYSFYRKQKEEEYNRQLHLYTEQTRKIGKLTNALNKRKSWAFSYQGETGKNGFAPVYEDISNKSSGAMRRAKVIEKRITMMIENEEQKKPQLKEKKKISFSEKTEKAGKHCLTIENLSKSYGKKLFLNFNLIVNHGERIAVNGANGSGKSTLLKMIAGLEDEYSGRIFKPVSVHFAYYSQEFDDLTGSNTILDEVTDGVLENQSNIRIALGTMGFRRDAVFRKISSLSSGEKGKVALVKAMFSDSNLLLLDEPTNHLEIRTREALEDALNGYHGSIVFASHDRYFVNRVATRIIEL